MPLHDWTDRKGWGGLHHTWITEIHRWVKPRLPAPYRAYIGTVPTVAVGAMDGQPDVGVSREPGSPNGSPMAGGQAGEETDEEGAGRPNCPPNAPVFRERGGLVLSVRVHLPP